MKTQTTRPKRPKKPVYTESQMALREGDEVNVRKDDGTYLNSTVKTPPWTVGGGVFIVGVVGIPGGYALDRVNPGHVSLLDAEGRRQCMYIDETQEPTARGYVPALVTEGVGGFRLMSGRDGAAPWVWGPSLDDAKRTAEKYNADHGVTKVEAIKIVMSSMSVGLREDAAALKGGRR